MRVASKIPVNVVVVRVLILLICLVVQSACFGKKDEAIAAQDKGGDYLLGLVGYNYTDRNISDYSVNGAAGGHVFLSSPASGGSGTTCCVRLSKTQIGHMRVKVRWQVDGCTYLMSNPVSNATAKIRHFHYQEIEVDVPQVAGIKPHYLETHFYPDGSVQVLLTEDFSEPRIVLSERRLDKSSFPRCHDDKKPTY